MSSSPTGLPPHLNLEQQRKRAKDLRKAHAAGQLEAAVRIGKHLPRLQNQSFEQVLRSQVRLSEAQHVVARESGFTSWPRMKHHIEQAALQDADVAELIIDAAFEGDELAVRALLSRDPTAGRQSIYVAAVLADDEAALSLLEKDSSSADRPGGRRNWTPLLYLCFSRYERNDSARRVARLKIAQRLLDLGANVNAPGQELGYASFNVTLFDQEEWYPLEAAAGQLADTNLIQLLLNTGAEPQGAPIALKQAVRGGNREVLRLLLQAPHHEWQIIWALKASAVLDKKDMAQELSPYIAPPMATNEPAVIEAIRLHRDAGLIELLLGTGNDPALRKVWENAMQASRRYVHRAATDLLRRRGAEGTAITNVDLVIEAGLSGNHAELQRLRKQHSPLSLREDDHRILSWAIRMRRTDSIPLLLEAGFDPGVPDTDGETPLHLAARANRIDVIESLLGAGAPIETKNFDGETPLDIAVARSNENVIQRLLAAGARPRAENSQVDRTEMHALFERAADAVASGDIESLRDLLDDEPELIHARSPRPHRATLLHYCGANGVEWIRQRTPPNAPDVMRFLLDRDADVNATCDLYGGGAATLGLLITSAHPIRAGLRRPLVEILVNAGAMIDGKAGTTGIVGAATMGRLDLVQKFFNSDDSLTAETTKPEMQSAFLWACDYGRTAVARFLLDHSADIAMPGPNDMTAAHLAALAGYLDTLQLLLQRGAPLEVENAWGGTVLATACYGATNHDATVDYVPVIEALVQAGARITPEALEWWAQQETLSASARERITGLLSKAVREDT